MATGPVPGGSFTLTARFFTLTNDFFSGSTRVEGTEFTYVGYLRAATMEPGEPNPGFTNTIWVSRAAPSSGRARVTASVADGIESLRIYTGSRIDALQLVRAVGMDNFQIDFLAEEGKEYHFQISGRADECKFSLQLFRWATPTNDFFAAATRLGHLVTDPILSPIGNATAEPGEPEHLGGAPFKSLWWHWTAPLSGTMEVYADRSLATNVVVGIYRGPTIGALTRVALGTNKVIFPTVAGHRYWIAAAVPLDGAGDVLLEARRFVGSPGPEGVSGNLLCEPSWEGTHILETRCWGYSGSLGGMVNERGGADGTTWPILGGGAQIWQDIATVPGWTYAIRFAMRASYRIGGGSGDGRVRVLWNNEEVGIAVVPEGELEFWNWPEFTVTANQVTSRVAFVNLGRGIELDAFSVVALTEPPQIVQQPRPASTMAGGTVVFDVVASGSAPLAYEWFFEGTHLVTMTLPTLVLENVNPNMAGLYQVVVSNAFGRATSAVVRLTVEAATQPVILWQPYGDTVAVGAYYNFSVVAAGTPPLRYQWYKNGMEIAGASNRTLTLRSVEFADAGIYTVRVENEVGIVWSLGAKLIVTSSVPEGGQVLFGNRLCGFGVGPTPRRRSTMWTALRC
jgi:hypothetical protein